MKNCPECELAEAAGMALPCRKHRKRLTAPEGSPPETGSRTRVAGTEPGDPLTTTSELPFADQAEPAAADLLMVAAHLRRDAHWYRQSHRRGHHAWASSYEIAAAHLEAIAESPERQSVAQSDRNEGERCGCEIPALVYDGDSPRCIACHKAIAPGVGVERSGSANAGHLAPPPETPESK